ncbi:4-hydroxy-tetrahydrodipicolinate reductase [Sodalis sp. CWE]|uniref:4-hydroxy-tetrahydrodipicolinate reductase n=1 Tax=Sodalis sp. CWE TaxID=2803816 RepID=UPI001C7DA147|nr:4-hydroxy-tetrahydrodipicolinate reductase [Sodalis sp. CWE]MBX4180725.1 4-hydroxy-tetrahydrodipicolinate reductase [Sodalis sp. CWE]
MCKENPVLIAIAGATGRMGRELIQAVAQSKRVILGAAITHDRSTLCGIDAGELVGINRLGVLISSELEAVKNNFDILIDFTCPNASMKYLAFCHQNNKSIVIGTTGFNQFQKNIIKACSKSIGIVFSANFSIGASLMLELLKKAAKIVGESCDIEIIEMHHRDKKDAPSATAIAMGKNIACAIGEKESNNYTLYDHKKYKNRYKMKKIGFSIIRAGDIIGEHTAIFAGIGERLEITHKALNRATFTKGVIRAVTWLADSKKKGFFNMQDLLNQK